MLSCIYVWKQSLPSIPKKRGHSILLYKYSIVIHGKPFKHLIISLDVEGVESFPRIILLFLIFNWYHNFKKNWFSIFLLHTIALESSTFQQIPTWSKIVKILICGSICYSRKWMRPTFFVLHIKIWLLFDDKTIDVECLLQRDVTVV